MTGPVVEPRSVHGREHQVGTSAMESGDLCVGGGQVASRHVIRDIEAIDAELELIVNFRHHARQRGGPPPLIDVVDALLDERLAAIFAIPQ